ncbi:AMM_1a_G0000970.mRNA.1.CDS.1 [Saccharomyces cerevisiae]|nr:HLJ1_G0049650.mRNA.1.CDS.1 [Saccharomyces cerevisiae]CAI4241325.1 AMM_1a_G0000970.mRNA.1.CDS.1 [Saccharomyces cerevisiae]CAI4243279.1 BBL_G0000860.mRNA.1.CDS.1 [Saccharomyces cerevisiae]CAI4245328.1 CCN_G0000860.mRNA.1.CDS.1 [Saccharomyces cerevisiae]CAI6474768.1 AMM_1a_G0000970.mRNA.1.CDS.1 [Saccharomyces cerevisiae]
MCIIKKTLLLLSWATKIHEKNFTVIDIIKPMYEYLSLTRKNALFCLAINEPSPIFALTIIAIFSSTNVRSSVVRLGCF